MSVLLPDLEGHWLGVSDGDARARAIYLRHYSARRRVRRYGAGGGPSPSFVSAGERQILMTGDCTALFVWHRVLIERADGQEGVCCSVFRNEGPLLSSDLIREADGIAWRRWPDVPRHFTYVDPRSIRSSNPGFCYLRAGWRRVKGYRSKAGGFVLLELLPEWVAS